MDGLDAPAEIFETREALMKHLGDIHERYVIGPKSALEIIHETYHEENV